MICRCLRALVAAICLIAPPAAAIAQETVNYASVAGRITDPSGAVVVGAEVVARHDGHQHDLDHDVGP